jgi:hypothetical protein
VPLRIDRQAFEGRGSGGLLLLLHSNLSGTRAAAVPVSFADCSLEPCPTVTASVAPATRAVTLRATVPPTCSQVGFEWDFGDGSPGGAGSTVTHSYDRPGVYTWHVTVRAAGQSCTTGGTVTVGSEVRRRLPRA